MKTPDPRIDAMLRRDLAIGVVFTCVMWVALVFVYLEVLPIAPGGTLRVVLGLASLALGAFNTASMVALIQRYRIERHAIYGEDLHNLDLARAVRSKRREVES